MLTLFIKLFFILWLACIIAWQFSYVQRNSKLLIYLNRLKIFPIWTFFSPNPGVFDTHILYRDTWEEDNFTEWQECPLTYKRQFYHFIWNPKKRLVKLVVDSISEVKEININLGEKGIDKDDIFSCVKVSRGYLVLLNVISALDKINEESVGRQFLIVNVFRGEEAAQLFPLFYSAVHEL